MVRKGIQFYWRQRAMTTPADWHLNFLIRLDGKVIGNQGLYAENFAELNEVSTGSWIGQRHQSQGIGTEMRAAVLMFAFDHLRAQTARSSAFTDNKQSIGVSRRLGYEPDGTFLEVRRGRSATQTRLRLTAERFKRNRPPWHLEVTGFPEAAQFLGLT